MDPQSQAFTPYSSNNETWRLQSDVIRVQQVQAEHAERIARLERRQEEDARVKSVWGQSSPFPSVLSGTPQQSETRLRFPFAMRMLLTWHCSAVSAASDRSVSQLRRRSQQPHEQPTLRRGGRAAQQGHGRCFAGEQRALRRDCQPESFLALVAAIDRLLAKSWQRSRWSLDERAQRFAQVGRQSKLGAFYALSSLWSGE